MQARGAEFGISFQQAPPGMVKSDRQTLLESIDERHDALIDDLDALNAQIEAALTACSAKPRVDDVAPAKT